MYLKNLLSKYVLACKLVAVCIFSLFCNLQIVNAQVGIGTTTPEAALDITSTNAGVLIPRFSLASVTDVSVISNPNGPAIAIGTLIFNDGLGTLNTVGFYYWNGTAWTPVGALPETRAVKYNSTDTTTDLSPAFEAFTTSIPIFGNSILNDDTALFNVQSATAMQITEAGRYRISLNLYLQANSTRSLLRGGVFVNGVLEGTPFTTSISPFGINTISVTYSEVLVLNANDVITFLTGSVSFNTFVTLTSINSRNSTVTIEKIN